MTCLLRRPLVLLLPTLLLGSAVGRGQPRGLAPVRGVVWAMPARVDSAAGDLRRIRAAGFDAVRTGLVADDRLLGLADSLGLALYQDLPLDYLPAGALADTLPFARGLIGALAERARRHPSVRHVGLAYRADTSVPAACRSVEALAGAARARGLRPYYVPAFVEADRCAGAVDLVLLPARDDPDPGRRLDRWRAAHPRTPAGVALAGAYVVEGETGLRAPHSPETQARALEALVGRSGSLAEAPLFLYRWRDGPPDAENPAGRAYGLVDAGGRARPALGVVGGLLTGVPAAFAFGPGDGARLGLPWTLVFFWGGLLLIALAYAVEPRMRALAVRYFRAHGFYRDGVRDARDTMAGAVLTHLVAVALLGGVLVAALLTVLRTQPVFEGLVARLPGPVAGAVVGLAEHPGACVLFVALMQALLLGFWAMAFYVAAQRRYLLSLWQAVGLILWPRWTLVPFALAALLTRSLPPPLGVRAALVVAALAAFAFAWSTVRTLLDLRAMARVPLGRALALALVHPFLLVGLLFLAGARPDDLAFLWHLATRT